MKRKFLVLLSLILALVLSLTLASCGGSDDDDDDSSSDKDGSNDTQEVTSKTWDKYFELDNIMHFEIEYSAVTEEDETIEVSYLFDDGFYEYASDFYGDDYGEDTPNHVLDLPFPSVISFLKEADADIDFNYKDFEYNKKTKSYTYSEVYERIPGVTYDFTIDVFFKNDVLVKIEFECILKDTSNSEAPEECVSEIFEFSDFEFSKSSNSSGDGEATAPTEPDIDENAVTQSTWDANFSLEAYPVFKMDYTSSRDLDGYLYPSFTYEYDGFNYSFSMGGGDSVTGEYDMTHILDLPSFICENTTLTDLYVFNSGVLDYTNYEYDGIFYTYDFSHYVQGTPVDVEVVVFFVDNRISEISIYQDFQVSGGSSYSTEENFVFYDLAK